ncbi:MAG: hypothetical protein WA125_06805 [Desulfosporosinus sp.]
MKIGFQVGLDYETVYLELVAMLHMDIVPYTGQEKLVIIDGAKTIAEAPLEGGKTYVGYLKNDKMDLHEALPFSLGALGIRALQEGFLLEEAAEPRLDLALHSLREALMGISEEPLWYVSASPWGYPYSVALTHDLDSLSLREYPVGRTFLGFIYRSTVGNFRRWCEKKITAGEFGESLARSVQALKAKMVGGADAWSEATQTMLSLERKRAVFSSLYLMPKSGEPGRALQDPHETAPSNRAGFYAPAERRLDLAALEAEGWELGVHGLDAWADAQLGRDELQAVREVSAQATGVRMHWLYFRTPESWQRIEEAGYFYDTTFGYNEGIGFRAGTLQAFHPLNVQNLWELPLHIQDGALLGKEHGNLTRAEALERALELFGFAERLGGTVTLLWHNASFGAPRFWGSVYERLLTKAQKDRAWLAPGREIIRWYALRRRTKVLIEQKGQILSGMIQRQAHQPVSGNPPELALFIGIPAERIQACSASWKKAEKGIIMEAKPGRFKIELKG